MRRFFLIGWAIWASQWAFAQHNDTLLTPLKIKDVTVIGQYSRADMHQLPEIVGTQIMAGKKNSLLVMDNVNGNVVTNTMRQVMAKIPGIHVWESDGSGIQIGVAARGLSPNRSWEFNTRQNGYDIAADPFGYPEAYYTPQLQAVQRIQIVRGAGALQYGPQFGGLINFVLRDGSDIKKPIQIETQNSAGSFGLFNSYNSVGGTHKKLSYFGFYDHRQANGWRQNSRYRVGTGFVNLTYRFSKKLKVNIEAMDWQARSQQPGGLTDKQFLENAQQSLRSRNWFNLHFSTLATKAEYVINSHTLLQATAFLLHGDRSSVGFLQAPTIADTIVKSTLAYNSRTADLDEYRNYGLEVRYLTYYGKKPQKNAFSAGLRYFNGLTRRYKNGEGTTGHDYNMEISGVYPQQMRFKTSNQAAFAENVFRINKRLIIIPGARLEQIHNTVSGQLSVQNGTPTYATPQTAKRVFLLYGVGAEYHIKTTELYGNISRNFRPVLFSDITGNPTTDVIDPNLQDAKGFNADLGFRGKWKDFLQFDVSVFFLQYNNRIGTLSQQRADGSFYNFRTNVGNSISQGVETYWELNLMKACKKTLKHGSISVFSSIAYTHAAYDEFSLTTKQGNTLVTKNYQGNRVENAPLWIARYGMHYFNKGFTTTLQSSYVSEAFSDANNTKAPTTNGLTGAIPAYQVLDFSINAQVKTNYSIKAGINNLLNERYFTRRAGGYPGPGLMPSDARNFFITLGLKI